MKLVRATLVKRVTSDGLVEMNDHVSIGKEYRVDADSRQMKLGYNFEQRKSWNRELIWTKDNGWLPTELLDIEEGNE